MAPTMPARPPLQSPATNPNAFADLANSVHGLRANGKLGGQGSSEDLAFPFADHSGTIRRTPCYPLPVHFFGSYPCHTYSSARGRVCAFTPHGRSAQRSSQRQTGKDTPWRPEPWPCAHWRGPSRESVAGDENVAIADMHPDAQRLLRTVENEGFMELPCAVRGLGAERALL